MNKLKVLPPRVDWQKRKNTIELLKKIQFIDQKNKISTYSKFK